jgi:hypothetical protein
MKSIYVKLHEAKKSIGVVKKNAKNPHFKNTYADLNALIEAVEPILLENSLILLQPIKDGKVFTEIVDIESGESVVSSIDLPTSGNPQQMGSAITYFRRYTLQSLLSLQADDDDGQMASKPSDVNALNILNQSTTLDELKVNWTKLSNSEQAMQSVINLKETLKNKLK